MKINQTVVSIKRPRTRILYQTAGTPLTEQQWNHLLWQLVSPSQPIKIVKG